MMRWIAHMLLMFSYVLLLMLMTTPNDCQARILINELMKVRRKPTEACGTGQADGTYCDGSTCPCTADNTVCYPTINICACAANFTNDGGACLRGCGTGQMDGTYCDGSRCPCTADNTMCNHTTNVCECAADSANEGGTCVRDGHTLLTCCTPHTHSDSGPGLFQFPGGPMDLVILCADIDEGKDLKINNSHCSSDDVCKNAKLTRDTEYPVTININGPHFTIYGGNHITFMVTNTADGNCNCPGQCPNGWKKFKKNCYKLTSESKNFHDMEDHCAALHPGGHLVSIHSIDESDFVKTLMQTAPKQYYIGLYDVERGERTPRGWAWKDCTPFDFQNWEDDQPDDWGNNEDCTHSRNPPDYEWNDLSCGWTMQGVCKYYLPPQ